MKMKKKIDKNKTIDGTFFKINKKIKKRIKAKYHKINDWVMDPKGYILISINRKKKIINVGYCVIKSFKKNPTHQMITVISGVTAIEIVNTLIKNRYISSLQHSADMGIELSKAELALNYKIDYTQDKNLIIK